MSDKETCMRAEETVAANAREPESKRKKAADALKRWGAFLGIAALSLFAALLPYLCRGNYTVWFFDGVKQHATFLEYMFRGGMYAGVGGYDYNIGLGADYLTSFAYYMLFDPVNLLLFVLPRGNFLAAYTVCTCVKFMLAAVCMYVYLRYKRVRQTYAVLFSVAYMLSGYMVFSFVRHPDLTAGAAFLPLVALGIERALDRNRPYVLIASVFLITVSSFYMTYMVTLYAIAYAALYYVTGVRAKNEKVRARSFCAVFFRTAGYYALGVLLAAFVLLPVAHGYLHGARSAGKGFPVYSAANLTGIAATFFAPVNGSKYTAVMFNIVTLALAFGAIAVTKHSAHRILSIALAACMFIPFAGFVMNMGNYASNRYSYMLSFSVYAMLAEYAQSRCADAPAPREANAMVRGLIAAAIVFANLALWAGVERLFAARKVALAALGVAAAVVVVCASLKGATLLWRVQFARPRLLRFLSFRRLFTVFAAFTLVYAVAFGAVVSREYDDGTLYGALTSPAETAVSELHPDEFVRVDELSYTFLERSNRSLNNGYRGTQTYNTMASRYLADFLRANRVYAFSDTLGSSGLGGRLALQAVCSVAYFRADEGDYLPAGYEKTDTAGLYRTQDRIPFGTVFAHTVDTAQWERLPAVERQYALLSAVAVQGGEAAYEHAPLAQEYIPAEVEEEFTLKKGEERTLSLPPENESGELYLAFSLKKHVKSDTYVHVACGKTTVEQALFAKGDQFFSSEKNFLYKLDEAGKSVRLFVTQGEAVLQNVRLYVAPVGQVQARIRAAAALPHLTDTAFSSTGFTGNISSDGGMMRIPLCYGVGWSASVDGSPVAVRLADAGLMAIEVPAGVHEVRFTYRTPWLNAGLLVSAIAAAGLAMLIVWQSVACVVKRRKRAL
ncbi:MAG: YfhO family protein [Clostridiales bacterium]|nr:YfhO family protein [Clostridiales bacterium]